jgi:hypothetical protein
MARAMPVISINAPRNTNNGTANKISECRKAEGKADRHTGGDARTQQQDKKEHQRPIAHRVERRGRQRDCDAQHNEQANADRQMTPGMLADPGQGGGKNKRETDRHRRGAPTAGQVQRRRVDGILCRSIAGGVRQQQQSESGHGDQSEGFADCLSLWAEAVDQRGHTHVPPLPQGDDAGAE